MKGLQFPLHKTKVDGLDKKFDLTTPEGRKEYFEAKAPLEIAQIKDYMKSNTFVAYLMAKKSAGKGTYTKIFMDY